MSGGRVLPMQRKALAFTVLTTALLLASVACKNEDSAATADGGKVKKFICKMNNQCWICPDDDAMKKCIINPVTSGCKVSTSGDCS